MESLLTHQAAPGTEVLVLSLDPVGGKSRTGGKKEKERVSLKTKMFQTVLAGVYSQGDWENCPREGQVNLLPNSQYESVRSLLGDKSSEKGHPSGLQED